MIMMTEMDWAKKYLAEQTSKRNRKAAIHAIVHKYQSEMSYNDAMSVWPVVLDLPDSYHTEIATAWKTAMLLAELSC